MINNKFKLNFTIYEYKKNVIRIVGRGHVTQTGSTWLNKN